MILHSIEATEAFEKSILTFFGDGERDWDIEKMLEFKQEMLVLYFKYYVGKLKDENGKWFDVKNYPKKSENEKCCKIAMN